MRAMRLWACCSLTGRLSRLLARLLPAFVRFSLCPNSFREFFREVIESDPQPVTSCWRAGTDALLFSIFFCSSQAAVWGSQLLFVASPSSRIHACVNQTCLCFNPNVSLGIILQSHSFAAAWRTPFWFSNLVSIGMSGSYRIATLWEHNHLLCFALCH